MRVKPVSINLSRSTLSYHFLADQLLALITKHNIDISLLELEVTETAEVDNQLVFSQALEKLKEYGFSISIDDFGVRNASLSLFTTINFDILKLDRSLVKHWHKTKRHVSLSVLWLSFVLISVSN